MKKQLSNVMLATATAAVVSVFWLNVDVSRAQNGDAENGIPRTPLGNPNLSGIWQTNNEAHWGLEPRAAVMKRSTREAGHGINVACGIIAYGIRAGPAGFWKTPAP